MEHEIEKKFAKEFIELVEKSIKALQDGALFCREQIMLIEDKKQKIVKDKSK